MQSLRIAFRNVTRQSRRTLLLGGAIAFGFAVFTLINGFTAGLLATVEDNLADVFGGHVYVAGSEVSPQGSEILVIRDTAAVEEAVASLGDRVASSSVRSAANASVIFGAREETLFVIGVDARREPALLDGLGLDPATAEAFLAADAPLLLPERTLEALGLEPGESAIVKASTVRGQVNVADFVVVGTVESQQNFGIDAGYADIAALNALLGMAPDEYQVLNLYLEDLGELEAATAAIYDELERRAVVVPRDADEPGPDFAFAFGLGGVTRVDEAERWEGTKFDVTNLNDNLEGINALVGVMRTIGLIIFLVIVGIIMVGVMNSYRMVMIERTAEIGTMRAMGVQRAGIRAIFLWEAFLIALGGALAGLLLALVGMVVLGLPDFGASDFAFFLDDGNIHFAVTPLDTLGNLLLLCALSVAAVFVPARAAARLEPAEALRATY